MYHYTLTMAPHTRYTLFCCTEKCKVSGHYYLRILLNSVFFCSLGLLTCGDSQTLIYFNPNHTCLIQMADEINEC